MFKYQHDTDKDLKYLHVFTNVDLSAAEAEAAGGDPLLTWRRQQPSRFAQAGGCPPAAAGDRPVSLRFQLAFSDRNMSVFIRYAPCGSCGRSVVEVVRQNDHD